MLLHTRVRGEQFLELVHLERVVLTAPGRIDENEVLAAVTGNCLFEIRRRVDDLNGQSQDLRVFFQLLHG